MYLKIYLNKEEEFFVKSFISVSIICVLSIHAN